MLDFPTYYHLPPTENAKREINQALKFHDLLASCTVGYANVVIYECAVTRKLRQSFCFYL